MLFFTDMLPIKAVVVLHASETLSAAFMLPTTKVPTSMSSPMSSAVSSAVPASKESELHSTGPVLCVDA